MQNFYAGESPFADDLYRRFQTQNKNGQVRYLGIHWTHGRYDTMVISELRSKKWQRGGFKIATPDGPKDLWYRSAG
jgi:hypothetical protein